MTPAMKEITKSLPGSLSEVSITTSRLVTGLLFVTVIFFWDGTDLNLLPETFFRQNVLVATTAVPKFQCG